MVTLAIAAAAGTISRDIVIKDDGAASHIFNDLKWFLDTKEYPSYIFLKSASRDYISIELEGIVRLVIPRNLVGLGNQVVHLHLKEVKYIP